MNTEYRDVRGDAKWVLRCALTMGVVTKLDARELTLLESRYVNTEIVATAVEGPITSMVSTSAIQLHPDCKVFIDGKAASLLKGWQYCDYVFENEPEWEKYRQWVAWCSRKLFAFEAPKRIAGNGRVVSNH